MSLSDALVSSPRKSSASLIRSCVGVVLRLFLRGGEGGGEEEPRKMNVVRAWLWVLGC